MIYESGFLYMSGDTIDLFNSLLNLNKHQICNFLSRKLQKYVQRIL